MVDLKVDIEKYKYELKVVTQALEIFGNHYPGGLSKEGQTIVKTNLKTIDRLNEILRKENADEC